MNVLITCGPTWVAIDDVRVISNQSTGEMGHLLAREFQNSGAKVTLLEGQVTHPLNAKGIKVLKYAFFDELDRVLSAEVKKKYDVIIHAAAVSDFKPARVLKGKVASQKSLQLHLVPTSKIINKIKRINPDVFLVGFKLEPDVTAVNAARITKKLFSESQCDLVIANSVGKGYKGFIVDADGRILAKALKKEQLAMELVKLCN